MRNARLMTKVDVDRKAKGTAQCCSVLTMMLAVVLVLWAVPATADITLSHDIFLIDKRLI
jgi:hypothetical protein